MVKYEICPLFLQSKNSGELELEALVIFLDQEKEIIKPVMTITLHNGMSML
jgi:hypothetical protein